MNRAPPEDRAAFAAGVVIRPRGECPGFRRRRPLKIAPLGSAPPHTASMG